MVDEFAPKNLRARLAAVQDRIAQAKSKLEAHGIVGDQTNALSGFAEQHSAISGSLDTEGTITELQHSKVSAQTDALESALHTWLQGIENTFNNPTPQRPNVSV